MNLSKCPGNTTIPFAADLSLQCDVTDFRLGDILGGSSRQILVFVYIRT